MLNKNQIETVFTLLDKKYPKPKAPLVHKTAYQLLVAVILSAQCTDERVNKTTPALFKVAPTPQKMLKLGEKNLKTYIKSCGFFNAKAKNIIKMTHQLIANHKGKVPDTLDALTELAGVANKTASCILSQWFHQPAFAVDTHVHRVSNRIGLTRSSTPEKTYRQVTKKVPKQYWMDGSLQLVFHGRYTCKARKPECKVCILKNICQYKYKNL
jgi:endonuclease-3